MPTVKPQDIGGLQAEELADQLDLLRQEVVVLRESIDEFRDELVHVLRKIADEAIFAQPNPEFFQHSQLTETDSHQLSQRQQGSNLPDGISRSQAELF